MTKPQKHLDGFYRRKISLWYSRHQKLVRNLVLWIGIPLGLIILVGFIPFSNDMLRQKVERTLSQSLAASCSIRRMSFTPWRGFSIEGLELTNKEGRPAWQLKVPRGRLFYRILPLFFKCVVIKNFSLKEPEMRLVLPSSKAAPEGPEKTFTIEDLREMMSGFPFTVVVKNISVEKGRASIEEKGRSIFAGDGINISLRIGYKKVLTLDGGASAQRITLAGLWDIDDVHAHVRAADLTVVISRLKGDFYGGKFTASGEADLGGHILEKFRSELSHVNLAMLYRGSRINQGACDGRLDAKIELDRSDLAPDSLKGRGRVRLSDVSVHDLPLQNNLIVFVTVPQIKNITFSRISTDLEIRNGKAYTPNIHGDGDPLEIGAEGWVGFDGYFSEKMNGIFSRDLVRNFHPVIANALDDEADGKKSFKCTIDGKFKNPHIDIDKKIKQRAVNNVIDELSKGLGKLFKK